MVPLFYPKYYVFALNDSERKMAPLFFKYWIYKETLAYKY